MVRVFTQSYGIEYLETFVPGAKLKMVLILLSHAAVEITAVDGKRDDDMRMKGGGEESPLP